MLAPVIVAVLAIVIVIVTVIVGVRVRVRVPGGANPHQPRNAATNWAVRIAAFYRFE
jgi:hypothetical protein